MIADELVEVRIGEGLLIKKARKFQHGIATTSLCEQCPGVFVGLMTTRIRIPVEANVPILRRSCRPAARNRCPLARISTNGQPPDTLLGGSLEVPRGDLRHEALSADVFVIVKGCTPEARHSLFSFLNWCLIAGSDRWICFLRGGGRAAVPRTRPSVEETQKTVFVTGPSRIGHNSGGVVGRLVGWLGNGFLPK